MFDQAAPFQHPNTPTPDHPVAYFCAEFGLEAKLPIYAGGLGILAGDTLKAAVDAKYPMIGIGLLYRGEASVQMLTPEGVQTEGDMPVDPLELGLTHVDVDDQPLFIKVHLTEVEVWMHCWKKDLGNGVVLYLLDTETEQNYVNERTLSHALYCGSDESQIKQMLLLGIGGVKLLHALGIHPSVYHLNEGRPAFLHWQLIRDYMDNHGLSYPEAKQQAIAKTVYTNHTLVGAGNPGYPLHLVKTYGSYYAAKMGIGVDTLVADGAEFPAGSSPLGTEPGVVVPTTSDGYFSITKFALNTSRKASGVSQLHYRLSQQAWPQYNWVGITNGVHMPTWQDPHIAAADLSGDEIWYIHQKAKQELSDFVFYQTGYQYDPQRLVVTWARRLAGYKRFDALFADIERLRSILAHTDRPVQLLLAGKAHFGDTQAKATLKQVIDYFKQQLAGYALFIPNYNIDVAKMLVKGSDVWLNTPEYGKEASGTSGMKAMSNGVLNCTVADGWVPEVEWQGRGWTLDSDHITESLYTTLGAQVAPLYYRRDEHGVPQEWVSMMKANIITAPQFSTQRMLQEYHQYLYTS